MDGDPAAASGAAPRNGGQPAQEALDETKELAHLVYPPLLDGRGLAGALRSAAERPASHS